MHQVTSQVDAKGVEYLTVFAKPFSPECARARRAVVDRDNPERAFLIVGHLPGRPDSPLFRRATRAEALAWLRSDPLLFKRAFPVKALRPPAPTVEDLLDDLEGAREDAVDRGFFETRDALQLLLAKWGRK